MNYVSARNPVDAFRAAPTRFMDDFVVIPKIPDTLAARDHDFTIAPERGLLCRRTNGSLAAAYELRVARGGEDSFQAFWCPYVENRVRHVLIGPTADFVFTALMSGCSLGVGSRTPQDKYLISHANKATHGAVVADATDNIDQGRETQRAAQARKILRRHRGDSGVRLIEPGAYRVNPVTREVHLNATTFGVRDRAMGRWAFYCQRSVVVLETPVRYEMYPLVLAVPPEPGG
jgi:hypothetical protein